MLVGFKKGILQLTVLLACIEYMKCRLLVLNPVRCHTQINHGVIGFEIVAK